MKAYLLDYKTAFKHSDSNFGYEYRIVSKDISSAYECHRFIMIDMRISKLLNITINEYINILQSFGINIKQNQFPYPNLRHANLYTETLEDALLWKEWVESHLMAIRLRGK